MTPPTRILYTIEDAAEQVSQSVKTLRRAIHATDSRLFPPPLRAKRLGTKTNSEYRILHADLVAWAESLPDA